MAHPVIGWEHATPVPNHTFNDFLSSRDGRLYYEDLDLTQLLTGGRQDQGLGRTLSSPLEIVYLPKVRQKVAELNRVFADVAAELNYAGRFQYAYASKANTAEEVVRAALDAGAHYEMSSQVDTIIVQMMQSAGHLKPDRMVLANGFKPAGSGYARSLVQLKSAHDNLIPILEDLTELAPFIESGLRFDVGLRLKCYGHRNHGSKIAVDAGNSRFGLPVDDLWKAADIIASAPNLNLKLFHAMIGSQITSEHEFVGGLKPAVELYARLRQRHSELSIFDFGGGMPAPMTLNFQFDYRAFARLLMQTFQEMCARFDVPVPDILGEMGRYTVTEHGAHFFKVLTVKDNGSPFPWYVIDGSIMTSFPDTWALSEHFIVLPLNHLDRPFQRVQLGGLTCDSDDVYPPKPSQSPLYLPVETKDLYIGFFCVGAYQEMLGGVGGSKHCVLPEANELLVDREGNGPYQFRTIPGQTSRDVLRNLGYPVSQQ
jgi:arginine decarboxylase